MIKRPEKKFEKSLMIAGGSSFYGLSDLILCEGTLNEFSYGQALIIYKEQSDKLNKILVFEQDGVSSQTSKNNLKLIAKLFKKNFYIIPQILLILRVLLKIYEEL